MIDIPAAQAAPLVTKLLAAPESRWLDVKRVSGKMVHRALETICAFANTEGGALVLGVDDPAKAQGAARLFGLQENPEAVDELQRKLRTQFSPALEGIRLLRLPCTLHDGTAGHLALVQVDHGATISATVRMRCSSATCCRWPTAAPIPPPPLRVLPATASSTRRSPPAAPGSSFRSRLAKWW